MLTPNHEEACPFKVTLCFLSFRKSNKTLSRLSKIPFCFSSTLCQRLLVCQEKRLSLQTCHQKTYIYFSWVMDKNWLMQDSPGLKPDQFLLRLASVPILAWVGQWHLGGIYPSIMVLSTCILQLQSLQIVLHNLVPNFTWSSYPAAPSINKFLYLLTQLSVSILSV